MISTSRTMNLSTCLKKYNCAKACVFQEELVLWRSLKKTPTRRNIHFKSKKMMMQKNKRFRWRQKVVGKNIDILSEVVYQKLFLESNNLTKLNNLLKNLTDNRRWNLRNSLMQIIILKRRLNAAILVFENIRPRKSYRFWSLIQHQWCQHK